MKRASVASGLHDKGTAELSEGSSREEHTQKMVWRNILVGAGDARIGSLEYSRWGMMMV